MPKKVVAMWQSNSKVEFLTVYREGDRYYYETMKGTKYLGELDQDQIAIDYVQDNLIKDGSFEGSFLKRLI